jgi:hypothetical protein
MDMNNSHRNPRPVIADKLLKDLDPAKAELVRLLGIMSNRLARIESHLSVIREGVRS